jgi:hypothetical protein
MIEKLKERLKALEEQRQQIQHMCVQAQGVVNKATTDLLRIEGRIQEVQYLLKGDSYADGNKSRSDD